MRNEGFYYSWDGFCGFVFPLGLELAKYLSIHGSELLY
jgi:hypothetical protein